MPSSPRAERAALALAVLLPLSTLLLFARGAALTPPGKSFLWMHALNTGDTYAYLAWVEQARQGHLLFRVLFTEEPCRPLLFHPLFLAIGWAARLAGVAPIAAFHAARVLLGVLLLLVLHRFYRRRLASPGAALFALLYTSLGSGLGWAFVRPDLPAIRLPVDLWMPEAILFLTLLESPLFVAALILALVAYERLFPAVRDAAGRVGAPRSARRAGLIAAVALLLGFTHPFELVSIAGTLAVAVVLGRLGRFASPPGLLAGGLAFAAGALVPLAYVRLVLARDAVFAHWLAVVRSPSPPPDAYLLAFAPQLVLAAFALPRVLARRSATDLLSLSWIAATALLLYAPLAQQRRFVAGVQVPLTLLATEGLFEGIPALVARARGALRRTAGARPAPRSVESPEAPAATAPPRDGLPSRGFASISRGLRAAFLAASFATNAIVVGADLAYFRRGAYPLYLERDLLQAIAAFGERSSPDALLLASPEVAHFVPALTGRRVVAGHYDLTVDPPRKAAVIRRVLDPGAPAAERRALLDRSGVTHVLLSPYEAEMAGRDPSTLASGDPLAFLGPQAGDLRLAPVHRVGPVTLLEVVR